MTENRKSRGYWLPYADTVDRIYVCKVMFKSTLGYTFDKFITTALKITSTLGVTAGNKRGKHNPKHALTDNQKESAVSHI